MALKELERDVQKRRNKKARRILLNWLWANEPAAFEELWEEGISGEKLLSDLKEVYPPVYNRMISSTRLQIHRLYQSGPRTIRRPLRRFVI